MKNITVSPPSRTHPVVCGHELLEELPSFLNQTCPDNSSWLLVGDHTALEYWREEIQSPFLSSDMSLTSYAVSSGEQAKSKETLLNLLQYMHENDLDRWSGVIAAGGGTISDLASFAASIYMRGIYLIHLPTTLLAMMDSCIGGKTGINFQGGKNLLGSFYQPHGTLIETRFLETLPDKTFREGLAECIKHGIIEQPEILSSLENSSVEELRKHPLKLVQLITDSLRVKRRFVEEDEHDRGIRNTLNFGHTFAHAIESASNYEYLHGEAVSIGMIASLYLSNACDILQEPRIIPRVEHILNTYQLPTSTSLSPDRILDHLQYDKKQRDDQLKWILLNNFGIVETHRNISRSLVRQALSCVTVHDSIEPE